LTIPELCIKSPELGNEKGYCCICGKQTKIGYKFSLSDNFTGFSYLKFGNLFCPYCYTFMKNQNFRKHCWLATQDEILFLKRNEYLPYLLNPPKDPFAFYITKSFKKQGFLSGFQYVNYSQENYIVLTDFVGNVLINLNMAKKMSKLIEFLRERKVSKTQLTTGNYTMFIYKKAINEGWDKKIEETKKYIREPLWEVLCYVES